MLVNTRNGLFSNAGYGGGTFNRNAVGGMQRQHTYSDMSNLNAPYDDYSLMNLQGLGEDSVMLKAEDFPWLVESAPTKIVQKDMNAKLSRDGYNLLLEDGRLGPRTCGALKFYSELGVVVGACDAHTSEFIEPSKASLLTQTKNEVTQVSQGTPMWIWAVLAGGALIGTALYISKKKKRI